jgi:release factor glutamine methyltransferase
VTVASSPTLGGLVEAGVRRLAAAGVENPRLEAELLVADLLAAPRTAVIAHPEAPVTPELARQFAQRVSRRVRREPFAYLRGLQEFYGLALLVDRRVFIPRPETELLVQLALEEIGRRIGRGRDRGRRFRVVDVGTGSGAMALAIAHATRSRGSLAALRLVATDLSPDALAVAQTNAVAHGLGEAVEFLVADLLPDPPGVFDLVVANLPYVPSAEIDGGMPELAYEPRLALDGGPDGLAAIRRLLMRLPGALAPDGVALLEIGADQAAAALAAAAHLVPDRPARVLPDLSGRPRVLRLDPGGR